jgi:hypothetical protein
MRLAKQLKAQASSMKFASQIPTKSEFLANHNSIKPETSKSDENAKLVTNHAEESKNLLSPNRIATSESPANHSENSNPTITDSIQALPLIVTTNQVYSCANCEQQKLKTKLFKDDDDDDSLDSSSMNEEPIMV